MNFLKLNWKIKQLFEIVKIIYSLKFVAFVNNKIKLREKNKI